MPQLLDGLPVLYRSLLPPFFQREIPAETKATCSSCAMCEASCQNPIDAVDGVSRFFRPDTKCCTYHPRLPNYLVGALLADGDPRLAEGRGRVERRIASRVGVTPQWLRPPAKYNLLYNNSRQSFGRASTLLCPFYEQRQGSCTIWPYREAVCSTWFCKHVAGADGRQLWMSLKSYLYLMELQLSRYALLKLFPDYVLSGRDKAASSEGPLTLEELEEKPPPERAYAGLWQDWAGREGELYRACFDIVRALSAEELEKILGLEGGIELAILEKRYQAVVSPELPKVLKLNPSATVKWLPDGSVALGAYSEHEAIALPGAAYGLLVEFTGQEPVEAVRKRLREEKQADLLDDVLLELYRQRILTDARDQAR